MRRGVSGDNLSWTTATGIEPVPADTAINRLHMTVQDRWFAKLYLLKALTLLSLVVFWIASGLIALFPAYDEATGILLDRGLGPPLAHGITIVSSLADISVGVAIAFRKSCRSGLIAGIGVSLFYMAGAAVLTPAMWIEPLGALVKTFPAIVLMLAALATLDNR